MSGDHIPVITAVLSRWPRRHTEKSMCLRGFFAFCETEIGHPVSGAKQGFTYIIILEDAKRHRKNITSLSGHEAVEVT